MSTSKHIHPLPDYRQASLATYVAGFSLSVALSAAAFALVWAYQASEGLVFSRGLLLGFLALLAVSQIWVQVLFFLHMSTERRLQMNVYAGVFTVFVVLCLVIGSIWIMQNLDYNMMPQHTTEYMQDKEGFSHQ